MVSDGNVRAEDFKGWALSEFVVLHGRAPFYLTGCGEGPRPDDAGTT